MSWSEYEKRLNADGLGRVIEEQVKPVLMSVPAEMHATDSKAAMKTLSAAFTTAFFVFAVGFFLLMTFLPDTWWGVALRFIIFPLGFFGALAIAAWLNRKTIATFLLGRRDWFIAKSKAMTAILETVGLTYVAAPGGAPESLKVLQKIGFLDKQIKLVSDMLDDHGGLDSAVQAAVDSGLLISDVVVLGTDEQKARFYRQSALGHTFEDGIQGTRKGISFSALEWIERVEDAEDRYHLLAVFTAPHRLSGTTQLRSRKTPWPNRREQNFQDVQLVPEDFARKFRLRSTDQVEARTIFNPAVVERVLQLAHGDPFRAVASGDHLVVDVVGNNRFALVDLISGEWNDATISSTLKDIADLLDLVDVMADTFMLNS